MGFWISMLVMDLLIPVTMISFGWVFQHRPPKNINGFYGYRTTMSTKNRDTWFFAHRYAGKVWFWSGWAVLALSVIAMLLVFGKDVNIVGLWGGILCLIQCVPLAGVIVPTERALRRTFDENGVRRSEER